MTTINRRRFLIGLGASAAASLVRFRRGPGTLAAQGDLYSVYISRNGTPITNVQEVIRLAGGIGRFIGADDVVILKPNGQWPRQGYTHTESLKALIDIILNRPGGFTGEIIIAEHIHRSPADAMGGSYCWNISAGSNRNNNWPDMSYLQLVADYHNRDITRVTALPMYDVSQDPANWERVTGPADVPAGKHGWVRLPLYTSVNGRTITPSYPIFRSAYSGKLIDLHRGGGVWENNSPTGQQVKLIFLPTLNNHGSGGEDYAGITSAVKCHIGFQEGTSLHSVGYGYNRPDAVGDSVGHLITQVFAPTFYLTCAEYSGHQSRTGAATQTKTVGLCADPVTLDYWMSKHVLYPCNNAAYFNPDNDNNTRRTLLGCLGKGVGTVNESQMTVTISDLSQQFSVSLNSGWNWISLPHLPSDLSLNSVFFGVLDSIAQVKSQTQSALRSNGQWIGDLSDMGGIQNGQMYKVQANAPGTLTVTGPRIGSATPISLAGGWNWIAYYPSSPQSLSQALSSIAGQAQQVKSQIQSAIYQDGEWIGDLTQMEPGKGYAIRMATPALLTYPAS